ncbi:hypothetical protein HW555_005237 [Spodoptera exigua]|uniref:MADF domain-containing protein n=1 Tax=Spodoptera exigua TaxID=7107 RepID=A0A835GK66_SPOEX|nr:hypothetical protein HW555_005237 [Spodoptera exigua]
MKPMTFLEAYKSKPCIWNPKDANHKDKKKVADAWLQISHELKKPVKELKIKKEILMTTFRKHFKRKQDSIRTGAGTEDVYKPVWFAYQFMEAFLKPVYTCNYTLAKETPTPSQCYSPLLDHKKILREASNGSGDGERDNDTSLVDNETLKTPRPTPAFTQKSRRRPVLEQPEQRMAAAFEQLTNILSRRSERPPPPEEDECDLYSRLLAKKLRGLPKDERQIIMYEIDGLFINRLNSNRETPSMQ